MVVRTPSEFSFNLFCLNTPIGHDPSSFRHFEGSYSQRRMVMRTPSEFSFNLFCLDTPWSRSISVRHFEGSYSQIMVYIIAYLPLIIFQS
jgi:hypothetical protein